jgi:hypothetical protein
MINGQFISIAHIDWFLLEVNLRKENVFVTDNYQKIGKLI